MQHILILLDWSTENKKSQILHRITKQFITYESYDTNSYVILQILSKMHIFIWLKMINMSK